MLSLAALSLRLERRGSPGADHLRYLPEESIPPSSASSAPTGTNSTRPPPARGG